MERNSGEVLQGSEKSSNLSEEIEKLDTKLKNVVQREGKELLKHNGQLGRKRINES